MKTIKQMAGLALALSAAFLNAEAQSPKQETQKPQPSQRVQVRVADEVDGALGLAHAVVGDVEGNVKRIFAGPESAEQPLVISTGSLEDDDVDNLEQDLTIMARILDKSVNRAGGGDESEKKAMGIHLWMLGQAGRGPRNLYIDGHGAIFILNANMPLAGAKTAPDEKEKKEPTNSAWESTRNELFGKEDAEPRRIRTEELKFDAGRVDALKKNLTESLKNAANIRGLKDNETVTIVVQGPSGRAFGVAPETRLRTRPGRVDAFAFAREPGRGGPKTLLTLRAKKSDIDDFAKGKIDGDQFRKKVSVSNYQSGAKN